MTRTQSKVMKFGLVGIAATLSHYAVMFAGLAIWQAPVAWSFAGVVTGAIVGYLLNYAYTFASTLPHRIATFRYIVVVAVSISLNTLLIWLLLRVSGLPVLPAQICVTCLVFAVNYLAHSQLTFKDRST
jgi:putative flippase GtrA